MIHGVSTEHLKILNEQLVAPLKHFGATVWVFGSRAEGSHKEFSDVDIAYELPKSKNLPKGFLSKALFAIEDSRFPYKVDVVNWSELADSYKKNALLQRQQL